MAPRTGLFLLVLAGLGLVTSDEMAGIGTKLSDSTSAVGTSTPVISTTSGERKVEPSAEPTAKNATAESVQDSLKSDDCVYKDGHHKVGDKFFDGCVGICTCVEAGVVNCVSRCPPKLYNTDSNNCREIPDPDDSCCKVTVCDEPKASSEAPEAFTKGMSEATTSASSAEVKKGRALNMTSLDDSISRLDDVTMEEDEELHKEKKDKDLSITMLSAVTTTTSEATTPTTYSTTPVTTTTTELAEESCVHGENKYKVGQTFDKGCAETCLCGKGGMITCEPKCGAPLFMAGTNKDKYCVEVPELDTNGCCVRLICSSAVEEETTSAATTTTTTSSESPKPETKEPKEGCLYKNELRKTGEEFNDACEAVCTCEEAGHISCKPRCPPKVSNTTSDRCVAVPDPNDSCCMVVLCDVSIQEHDVHNAGDIEMDDVELLSASILNSTAVKLETSQVIHNFTVEVNDDKEWHTAKSIANTVTGLEPGKTYKMRIRHKGDISNEISVALPAAPKKMAMCEFKGKTYTRGEEFHDECRAFCVCGKTGVECANIECPSDFGLDVLDPHCTEWETHPPGFTPSPPHCCPEKMVCKNNGSCLYEGESYPNWSEIPSKLTGCGNRCFCESGNVTCQRVCPEVPKTPPEEMPCSAKEAVLEKIPGDDCCEYWQCPGKELVPSKPSGNKSSDSDVLYTTPESIVNYMTPQKPDGHKDYHKSKPYGDTKNIFDKKEKEKEKEKEKDKKNNTKHDAMFQGPFNPNFYQQKNASKHDFVDDILSPFHLQDYAQEIKDHLKNNKSSVTDEYEDYQDNNGGIEQEQGPPGGLDPYLGNKKNIWGIGQKPGSIYYPSKQGPDSQDPLLLHELGPYQNNKLHGRPETPLLHPGIGGSKHNPNQILQDLGGGFPSKGIKQGIPREPEAGHPTGTDGLYHQYLPNQDIYNSRLPSKYEEQDLSPHSDKEIIHIHSDHPLRVEDILTHIKNKDRPGLTHPHQHYLDPVHAYNPSAPLHQVEGLNKGFNGQFPPGFPPRSPHQESNEIKVHILEPLDETTVRLVFSVPAIFVGLHGRVELRYTSEKDNNEPSSWEQQVLAPPGDLIATPELEFELGGLEPDTFYKIKISVVLRDIQNVPSSQVLSVKTPPAATSATTLPPVIPVQVDLKAVEVNSTWAKISWRKFSDFELQFIDGVQLRYKELDGKVYAATPLIHRAVTAYTIEDLRSDATYEVGIFFIPFPGQSTELQAHNTIQISTTIENDPYKFELVLDLHHLKSSSVEVSWGGVPYPEDKYVNIFRIIYQSEGGKEDYSQFKLAKRDLASSNLVTELKPNTRYRLWLEAYLTNGRIKKSNVKDFTTKAGPLPVASTQQGKLEATPLVEAHDYYGPLIVVSILAALAIVSSLVLLLILAKKHGHNKAPITAVARKPTSHSAAYDNPSYKVDIQHETMDL
uniref:Epidermal cell surface receptor n=2 Tax=Cacopsylla melanoneura TaxID=428564 RepID=A0A8D8RZF6_9HEMI